MAERSGRLAPRISAAPTGARVLPAVKSATASAPSPLLRIASPIQVLHVYGAPERPSTWSAAVTGQIGSEGEKVDRSNGTVALRLVTRAREPLRSFLASLAPDAAPLFFSRRRHHLVVKKRAPVAPVNRQSLARRSYRASVEPRFIQMSLAPRVTYISKHSKIDRGRDAGRPAPPAQIPASSVTAPGSCLR